MAKFFETFDVIEGDGTWTSGPRPIDTFARGISLQTQSICNPPTPTNQQQTVTMNGTPTGGTFTLEFNNRTTTPLAYNASAASVQSALQAIAPPNATVTVMGPDGGPWVVTFGGSLSGVDEAVMTADNTGLTGGTSPNATASITTHGSNALAPASYALGRDTEPFACTAYGIVPPMCEPEDYADFMEQALASASEWQISNALWNGYDGVTGDMYLEHPDVEVITRTGDPYTIVGAALERAYAKWPALQPVIHLGWQSAMSLQLGLSSLQLPFVVPHGYPANAIAVTGPVTIRLGSINMIETFDMDLNRHYYEVSRLASIEFDPGIAVRVADS
jgi:hypothetical protein